MSDSRSTLPAVAHARIRRMQNWLVRHAAWWITGAIVALAGSAWLARAQLDREQAAFETDARIVHRLISQRVVQQDAVLATLALLQPASGDAAEQRLTALYPQILSVKRRDSGDWSDAALAAAETQSRSLKRPVAASVNFAQGRYDLVLASHPASFAARMDLKAAVPWTEWPMRPETSPVEVLLEHQGQRFVVQPGRLQDAGWRFTFRKALAAPSQPFDVVATRSVSWLDLPWVWMLAWTVAVFAVLTVVAAWLRQREARRRAEELLRLGQVARLNTLGELAAGMAHELNQPLTALLANTQAAQRLLTDDPPEIETAREAMQQAAQQARRAADVVSRLRRTVERPGTANLSRPVSLDDAARHAMQLLQPEFMRRQVDVQLESAADAVVVLAEPIALEQIVHNLLMNALQAFDESKQDRRVRVTVYARDDVGVLGITDNGPGIEPAHLPKVFEPFFSTRSQGLGLGLSLCESLASGMGGRLEASNVAPHGAAFQLHLPLAVTA